ncbi:MlaD family protein [Nocardia blacklockiae]|uniref:MlaD family protein n=1 Tax=Nocardia blacklockiae TaxID=480036 RepID=UPI0018946298|nr:MlaD family protein [Nocardia blacklockiae]MBF6171899.1 MCE family protein [Nocardia blacklockiae]
MLAKILGSRGLMSAAVVLVLVVAAAAGLRLTREHPDTRAYCAQLPDSIGLYEGSAVTVLGVQVGKVTGIEPDGATTKVRFTVRSDRKLPPDVGAVTVSENLIADRNLALIGDEPAGPGWDPGTCITKALTPKSLSETFDALAGLADKLNGAGDPERHNTFGAGLDALDRATAGTGDQLNDVIQQLGKALAAPDAAIGHLGQLLDALTELAHRAHGGWAQVKDTIIALPGAFHDTNVLAFPPVVDLVAALAEVLPQLNDVFMMFGTPAVRAIDAIPGLPQLITAGVGTLTDLLRMTPAIAAGFAGAVDPASGRLTIGYAPPKLALPAQHADQVCAAVQAVTGQHCAATENGTVTVPALPALLAGVSAR